MPYFDNTTRGNLQITGKNLSGPGYFQPNGNRQSSLNLDNCSTSKCSMAKANLYGQMPCLLLLLCNQALFFRMLPLGNKTCFSKFGLFLLEHLGIVNLRLFGFGILDFKLAYGIDLLKQGNLLCLDIREPFAGVFALNSRVRKL